MIAKYHRAARDVRGWDVNVMEDIEPPRLLLPMTALDLEDRLQHRIRVVQYLLVEDIGIDEEHFHIDHGGASPSPNF